MKSLGDNTLPIPLDLIPGASRRAVLEALYEATINGRVGSVQERLKATFRQRAPRRLYGTVR
jgi:hypothetical protein